MFDNQSLNQAVIFGIMGEHFVSRKIVLAVNLFERVIFCIPNWLREDLRRREILTNMVAEKMKKPIEFKH
ncbi:MAG: hypothetical protein ABIH87_03000 [bacterium]